MLRPLLASCQQRTENYGVLVVACDPIKGGTMSIQVVKVEDTQIKNTKWKNFPFFP